MIQFKKILCPTDFSEPSLEGLRYAIELARTFEAELCLIHITPVFAVPLDGTMGVVPLAIGATDALRAESARRLNELAEQWIPPHIRHKQRLGDGPAAPEIVRLAEEENADVIVIATHGETGWRHLVFGSVAESVVRTAPCPVLTIRAPRENQGQMMPAIAAQLA